MSTASEESDAPGLDGHANLPEPSTTTDGPEEQPVAEALPVDPPETFVPAAPVVTGVRPSRVDARGGTQVTVFGAGFAPGCSVFVGEEELIAEVVDAFNLRFVAPSGNGSLPLVVVSVGGKRSPDGASLEFVPGPEISRVIPAEGPLEGGILVVVEGQRFARGCTVSLFGAHAPDVTFDGATRISFELPPAGDGPLEGVLVVTNPDGLTARHEGLFRYRALQPAIASVEPSRGWVSGGKRVTVRGADFARGARAFLGNREGEVTWRDAQTLDVEVPEGAAVGVVDVVVQNPDRARGVLERCFTYEPVPAPPKIIDVIPRVGSTVGGATVRITGDNFTDEVRVKIGEVTVMRKVLSAKLIDAELPARQMPGKVAIEVSLEGVVVRAEEAFTYESPSAPKITHLEPRTGPTGGGTRVVIEGESFPPNAWVTFGRERAKTVAVKNANRIETVTPPFAAAGVVDVEVGSDATGSGVSKGGFKYEAAAAPVISVVAPNKGTVDGGTELSVEGKNFAEGVVVLVGGLPAKTRRISGSVLEAITPGGDDGKLVDVTVKNPDGKQAVQKRAFQYDARYRS